MKNVFLMIIAGLLLVSCGGKKEVVVPDFDSAEIVCPTDSIAIEEILKPVYWNRVGKDKIVLFSEEADTVAYTYTFPDFKFLHKWGTVGEGPEDFQGTAYGIGLSGEDDTLRVPVRNKMRKYIVGDTTAEYVDVKSYDIRYIDEMSQGPIRVGGGSYYAFPNVAIYMSGEKRRQQLTIYDDVKNEVVDSVYLDVVSIVKQHSWGVQGNIYNVPSVVVTGDTLLVVYPDVHRVDAFSISAEGKLSKMYSVGDTRSYEEISALDWDNMPMSKEIAESCVDKDDIYVFYFMGSREAMDDYDMENISSYAVVYDMNGNIQRVKAFDRLLTNFICHEGKVYAFNFEEDFENVYIYTL